MTTLGITRPERSSILKLITSAHKPPAPKCLATRSARNASRSAPSLAFVKDDRRVWVFLPYDPLYALPLIHTAMVSGSQESRKGFQTEPLPALLSACNTQETC
jgi:hypothetical protein